MTGLHQNVEELLARLAENSRNELDLFRTLADAIRRVDENLLREVRSVTVQHELRREAILGELQNLTVRLCALPARRIRRHRGRLLISAQITRSRSTRCRVTAAAPTGARPRRTSPTITTNSISRSRRTALRAVVPTVVILAGGPSIKQERHPGEGRDHIPTVILARSYRARGSSAITCRRRNIGPSAYLTLDPRTASPAQPLEDDDVRIHALPNMTEDASDGASCWFLTILTGHGSDQLMKPRIMRELLEQRAAVRCANELGKAILYSRALKGLAKAVGFYGIDFIRLAEWAFFDQMFAHAIKALVEQKGDAGFWYLQRQRRSETEQFLNSHDLDLAPGTIVLPKLKKIRNKTMFHLDKGA